MPVGEQDVLAAAPVVGAIARGDAPRVFPGGAVGQQREGGGADGDRYGTAAVLARDSIFVTTLLSIPTIIVIVALLA